MDLTVRPLLDELRFAATTVTVVFVLCVPVMVLRSEAPAAGVIPPVVGAVAVFLASVWHSDPRYAAPYPWPEDRVVRVVEPAAILDAARGISLVALAFAFMFAYGRHNSGVLIPLIFAGGAAAAWWDWARVRRLELQQRRRLYRAVEKSHRIRGQRAVYAGVIGATR